MLTSGTDPERTTFPTSRIYLTYTVYPLCRYLRESRGFYRTTHLVQSAVLLR